MPTFSTTSRFRRDYDKMTHSARNRFRDVVLTAFVPDIDEGKFRAALRVKHVHNTDPGVFEMTWAPDGRATWQYGPPQRPKTPHVIWRRVGSHDIFSPGPP